MKPRPNLLVVLALTACASATTPEPHRDGHTDHEPSAQPISTASAVATGDASSSVDVTPAPAATTGAASSAPPASAEAPDVCEDLVKLCHDVGHDGGVTGKCHQVGHARDDKACKSEFSACKVACEAAGKTAQKGGKEHAH